MPSEIEEGSEIAAVKSQQIPDNPSKEEAAAIRKNLLKEFEDVFDGQALKPMKGDPVRVRLREDAVPFAIHTARPIPLAQREQVKEGLDEMERNGIIERVGDRPTAWCHPLVLVPKPGGKIRFCADLTKLNSQVQRPVHPARTPQEAITGISPRAKFFSMLDARQGYWQLELHEDSQDLTTFITPWGRYRHLRCPMGFIASGDAYNLRGDRALEGIGNVEKVVDDILAADDNFPAHVKRIREILERCREHRITLNGKKFRFAEDSVDFVGFVVSSDGIRADPEKVRAIQEFPEPANRTELRAFVGLCNQLGQFSAEIAGAAGPLREALRTRNDFMWTANLSQ
ncbi:MAG: reverse transcriptase family protein, partial [Gammaproteobacteria bacterium]|nr:reverse transcriptase family protein [Gammaproteobacteria bacterium]